ncbi:hypothetical protein SAMN06295967_10512 [Belliella buryatensis]|uniref:Protein required for attachment to host cells n=1 Tax=Belliella buryatensis TaxID=1500549 RepID=A0A239CFQ5_9BACT|nr:hypothetical protein [Belliella buryatensis]SNS18809.1 hypothetical protein SAMN06295967_10512 [Belliella buryatensis]
METKQFKSVGIWLDQSKAHFIGYHEGEAQFLETLISPHERIKREEGEVSDTARFSPNPSVLSNNEYRKNNIAQNELNEYYKMLEDKIAKYDDILLFGPGTAKDQFKNRLAENKSFSKKWVSVQNSDKMTDNQLLAFVRDFYKS